MSRLFVVTVFVVVCGDCCVLYVQTKISKHERKVVDYDRRKRHLEVFGEMENVM